MKCYSLLLILFTISSSIFAQLRQDSLQHVINSNRPFEERVNASIRLFEDGGPKNLDASIDEALKRYISSLKKAESSGDSLAVSSALSNIAVVNVIEKKFEDAESNLLRALRIRETLGDSLAIARTYSDLGAAMNDKGDHARAKSYLEKSNVIALQLGNAELQSNNYSELAESAQQAEDYQGAYDYFLKKSYLRDSLFAMEKARQIAELKAQFETSEKEVHIRQQEERIRLQNFIFLGIGGVVLLTGLLVHTQYRKRRLKQEGKLKTELMAQQQMEAKAVIKAEENERQRIARDLHDGVGQMMSAAKMNLSAFESEFKFQNDDQKKAFQKIIQLVDESCREVRTVSHVMMPNALLKNNLANAIREFVDKLGDRHLRIHVYTMGIDQRMDSNIETVLYRVIQECVNNAIRHSGATSLDISLVRENNEISGTIEDNGKGFERKSIASDEGIGLQNIASRIAYLRGTVDIDSRPGKGTVIAFHVPV